MSTRAVSMGEFPAERVAAAKAGRTVSVVVPARDEAGTVGAIVAAVRRLATVVDEVVVVDDGSSDATAAVAAHAGARVVANRSGEHGKGQAMAEGLAASAGDVVVFCDADVTGFDPGVVLGLAGPLLCAGPPASGGPAFVKGFYERPLHGRTGEGGRVTELAARPLVALLFPHLSGIVQPLAGEYAAWRHVLEEVPFVGGYGVDIALLIDVAARWGTDAIWQCDLGVRTHRNRPLTDLGPQALAIWQAGFERAGLASAPALRTLMERPGLDPALVAFSERAPLAPGGAPLR